MVEPEFPFMSDSTSTQTRNGSPDIYNLHFVNSETNTRIGSRQEPMSQLENGIQSFVSTPASSFHQKISSITNSLKSIKNAQTKLSVKTLKQPQMIQSSTQYHPQTPYSSDLVDLSNRVDGDQPNNSQSQLISRSIVLVKKHKIIIDQNSGSFKNNPSGSISRSKPKLLKHTLPKIIESRDEGRNQHYFRTVIGEKAEQEILLKLSPLANGKDAPMYSEGQKMKSMGSSAKIKTFQSEGALSPVKKPMRRNSPDLHPFMNMEEGQQCTMKKQLRLPPMSGQQKNKIYNQSESYQIDQSFFPVQIHKNVARAPGGILGPLSQHRSASSFDFSSLQLKSMGSMIESAKNQQLNHQRHDFNGASQQNYDVIDSSPFSPNSNNQASFSNSHNRSYKHLTKCDHQSLKEQDSTNFQIPDSLDLQQKQLSFKTMKGDSPVGRLLISRDTTSKQEEESLKMLQEHHQRYLNDINIHYPVNPMVRDLNAGAQSPSPANYCEDSNIMIEQSYSLNKFQRPSNLIKVGSTSQKEHLEREENEQQSVASTSRNIETPQFRSLKAAHGEVPLINDSIFPKRNRNGSYNQLPNQQSASIQPLSAESSSQNSSFQQYSNEINYTPAFSQPTATTEADQGQKINVNGGDQADRKLLANQKKESYLSQPLDQQKINNHMLMVLPPRYPTNNSLQAQTPQPLQFQKYQQQTNKIILNSNITALTSSVNAQKMQQLDCGFSQYKL